VQDYKSDAVFRSTIAVIVLGEDKMKELRLKNKKDVEREILGRRRKMWAQQVNKINEDKILIMTEMSQ